MAFVVAERLGEETTTSPELSPLVAELQGEILYQIPTTAWLHEISNKYRTLGRLGMNESDFTIGKVPDEEWDAIQGKGVHVIYFLGIFKRGEEARKHALMYQDQYVQASPQDYDPKKDVIGSPFAHIGYEYLDPLVAADDWKEFDLVVREKLRPRGIAVGVDYIPNHTGMDHPRAGNIHWFYMRGTKQDYEVNPGRYIDRPFYDEQGEEYHIAHGWHDGAYNNMPWTDTAQINLADPRVQELMIQDAIEMVLNHEIDLLRFDMVHITLPEKFAQSYGHKIFPKDLATLANFWPKLLTQVKQAGKSKGREIVCVAETYGQEEQILRLGFDFVYGDGFYKLERAIAKGDVGEKLTEYRGNNPYIWQEVHYQENHDESRSASPINEDGSGGFGMDECARAFATVSAFRPYGMWMIFYGQEDARIIRPPAQTRRVRDEQENQARVLFNRAYYTRLFKLRTQAIVRDRDNKEQKPTLPDSAGNDSYKNISMEQAIKGNQGLLVCTNLSWKMSTCHVRLPQNATNIRVVNLDDGEEVKRSHVSHKEGTPYLHLYIELDRWRSQMILYELADIPLGLVA